MKTTKRLVLLPLFASLAGCASIDISQTIDRSSARLEKLTSHKPLLALTSSQKAELERVSSKLLSKPLDLVSSVELMLSNSPRFQALLASSLATSTSLAQSGRIPNPVFNFERVTVGSELEFGRLLSVGLLDILSLPWRQQSASLEVQRAELQLAADVSAEIIAVQEAWIDAVLAIQKEKYAKKIVSVSQADAQLARRLNEVGNFTATQRIRRQLFYSEAVVSHALLKQKASAAREKLVRLLGLTADQQRSLIIPDNLPKLPLTPLTADQVSARATNRLDVDMAKLSYEAAAKRFGIDSVNSFVDVEFGVRKNSVSDRTTGESSKPSGYELDVRLPLFDWGDLKRSNASAELLYKANTLEATLRNAESTLRESYVLYRTSFDIAKHFISEVIPMREALAEESVYQYNGMLISTFDLVAESKDQVQAIQASMDAQANFFKAQLALESNLIGNPLSQALQLETSGKSSTASGGH